ncbi:MAG: hypothetical protein RR595_11650 [Lysinibacillus sp.]
MGQDLVHDYDYFGHSVCGNKNSCLIVVAIKQPVGLSLRTL